jgi:hypothetical protein
MGADEKWRHKEAISHNKMMRFMLAFVNVIVFVLQLLVVIIWQMTMDSLLTNPMDDDVFYLFLQKQKSAHSYIPQGYFPPYEAV